ncbi:MAG: esterase-like activity of phytase family protein [Acidobacteriota bacterium]
MRLLAVRLLVVTGCALFARSAEPSSPAARPEPRLTFLGDFNIPTGTSFGALADTDFGGISGLVFHPRLGKLLALSDSRMKSRFYILDFKIGEGIVEAVPVDVVLLRDARGQIFDSGVLDPEAIALTGRGTLLVASEGDSEREPRVNPAIFEFDLHGRWIRAIPVPEKFLMSEENPPRKGVRNNKGFESLTVSPDGRRLFAGTESTLIQDGMITEPDGGGYSRIIEYRLDETPPPAVREYAYYLEPLTVPPHWGPSRSSNGLAELLALDDTHFLALERGFVTETEGPSPRNYSRVRIYLISLAGASDVSRRLGLETSPDWIPVSKQLLLDLDDVVSELSPGFRSLDNFEGMCFGPDLRDGSRSLVMVSDNNFRERQRTAFLLFKLEDDSCSLAANR